MARREPSRCENGICGEDAVVLPAEQPFKKEEEEAAREVRIDQQISYSNILQLSKVSKQIPTFKAIIKPKTDNNADCKKILKEIINPCNLKIGVSKLKQLKSGDVLIETERKKDISVLCEAINKESSELRAIPNKKFLPRMIIRDIPEEIDEKNAISTIIKQNSELNIKNDEITFKYILKNKRNNRNLIIEVKPELRKKLIDKRLKIMWVTCPVLDFIHLKKCYNCNKYNHSSKICKGELSCPLCAEKHCLKDCKATPDKFTCINCVNFNKYNKKKVNTNHSVFSSKCEYKKVIEDKLKANIDYGF
ncbi:hypothetical protein O3M35_006300 [Rhynocoris fuscipes]|uniref:Gag-like protein n=1 Tax=Rhynocoris fuscipes TaxID=488301 RepID=A0AAW1DK72_9HEMI